MNYAQQLQETDSGALQKPIFLQGGGERGATRDSLMSPLKVGQYSILTKSLLSSPPPPLQKIITALSREKYKQKTQLISAMIFLAPASALISDGGRREQIVEPTHSTYNFLLISLLCHCCCTFIAFLPLSHFGPSLLSYFNT